MYAILTKVDEKLTRNAKKKSCNDLQKLIKSTNKHL